MTTQIQVLFIIKFRLSLKIVNLLTEMIQPVILPSFVFEFLMHPNIQCLLIDHYCLKQLHLVNEIGFALGKLSGLIKVDNTVLDITQG